MVGFKKGDNSLQTKKRKRPNPPPVGGLVKVNTTGRPTVYHPDYPETVRRLRLLNNTREDVAKFFGVNGVTIDLWCSKYPLFNEAYAQGGEEADLEVIEALKHRARGYSHKSEKIFMNKDGEIVRAETITHYPPDTPAMSLWLANRQRDKWKLPSSKTEPDAADGAKPAIRILGGLPDE